MNTTLPTTVPGEYLFILRYAAYASVLAAEFRQQDREISLPMTRRAKLSGLRLQEFCYPPVSFVRRAGLSRSGFVAAAGGVISGANSSEVQPVHFMIVFMRATFV